MKQNSKNSDVQVQDDTDSQVSASEDSLISNDLPTKQTKRKLIYISGFICALNSVESSAISIGEWPYLTTLDEHATAQFYGYATSLTKIAHAIFAILFALWSYKTKSVKIPLAVGRFIAFFAYLLYICIEHIPLEKRYVMGSVLVLLAISDGSSTVMPAYIAKNSVTKDRAKAFAIIGLSEVISIVIGPLLQLIFSTISYPGYEVLPGLFFHIYSAPIWFAFGLTTMTIVIILVSLEDSKETTDQEADDNSDSAKPVALQRMISTVSQIKNHELDWQLIAVCLLVKVGNAFSDATVITISSIFFMVQYGWTGEQTVQVDAAVMIGFGVLSSIVLLLYIFCKLEERLPQHKVFFAATIPSGLVFALTYPFEFTSNPVVLFNSTTHSGCDPNEYPWCDTAYAVNPILYLASFIAFSAPAIPLMHTALDTVYSNILGSTDQSIAQGAMTVIDDIAFIFTPILTIFIFTHFGVGLLWILNIGVFTIIGVIWACNLERFGKKCNHQVDDS